MVGGQLHGLIGCDGLGQTVFVVLIGSAVAHHLHELVSLAGGSVVRCGREKGVSLSVGETEVVVYIKHFRLPSVHGDRPNLRDMDSHASVDS